LRIVCRRTVKRRSAFLNETHDAPVRDAVLDELHEPPGVEGISNPRMSTSSTKFTVFVSSPL